MNISIYDFSPAEQPKPQPKIKIEDFYPCESLCTHCLDWGYWEDEDKCQKCAREGHTSPWTTSGSCKKCKEIYDKGWEDLLKRIS